ncbi:anthranilate synthase component I [Phycisphaerales bacterium]|nr:anthranilate synthase component I [Phycisphaerales bacterium]
MPNLLREEFVGLVERERRVSPDAALCVPVCVRLLADQLTPVVAYRRLVAADERTAPSFLLESVEGGERQGRYSILGAQPVFEQVCRANDARWKDHREYDLISDVEERQVCIGPQAGWPDPFATLRACMGNMRLLVVPGVPSCFLGGWVGYAAYDSVRYTEPSKLPFSSAPADDRALPDLHFGFYDGVVVFDHVAKTVAVVQIAIVKPGDEAGSAYARVQGAIAVRIAQLDRHTEPLRSGEMTTGAAGAPLPSNLTREQHAAMVVRAQEYIRAGDVFQVVLGQRFERESTADPFDVYRALRAVNPSPYMVYMQCEGCILVASSPEILCRVKHDEQGRSVVTNRPLAGTRRRGKTPEEDAALERELLADAKERAEHIMLVDLGRNDVGRVAEPGTIRTPRLMEIERYSHVMHISSTVTGVLREGLDCWDALRAALPVGTISGAPKVRAMQIIDELEPVRRGPYGGGMGYVGLDGQMDIALTLRTMVVPTALRTRGPDGRDVWMYHLQAAGGIVADSRAGDEYQETVNKAAALARAIDVAERAFGG